LHLELKSADYTYESRTIPAVSASASVDKDGKIHISLCNLDPTESQDIRCEIRGTGQAQVRGEILTSGKMNDHNDFEHPDVVAPSSFDAAKIEEGILVTTLPPMSVVVLAIE
jgi:alpha-N-arabinofuranosidase